MDGATAPCDPTVPSCPDEPYCTDPFFKGPVVKSCRRAPSTPPPRHQPSCRANTTPPLPSRKTALDPECLYANYNVERYVDRVGGSTSGQSLTIASAFKGSVLYVGINGAIYSVSTFQPREAGLSVTWDGSGMTLIAGSPGVVGRVDSPVGVDARFYTILSMSESSDGRRIFLTDHLSSTTPSRGYLRSIDVTTSDYRVETHSGLGIGCSSSTFVAPSSVSVLSNMVMIVDAGCYTVHTYNIDTGGFVVTAGIAGTQGTFDGPCAGAEPGVFHSPQVGAWDPHSGNMLVLGADKSLKRISSPNTEACTVTTIGSGDILWSGSGSLIGGIAIDSPDVMLVVGGFEVREYTISTQQYTVIAGSYQSSVDELYFRWSAGTACGARVGLPTQILRHRAETHGGDNAIYVVDVGSANPGDTPSIWRYATLCSLHPHTPPHHTHTHGHSQLTTLHTASAPSIWRYVTPASPPPQG